MSPILIYILKVNVAILFMYLLYIIMLKRDTFFILRRYYLLLSIAFSFLLPFVSISSLGSIWTSLTSAKSAGGDVSITVGEPTIRMIEDAGIESNTINWQLIAIIAIVSVSLFMLIRFIVQLISIYRIWRESSKEKLLGVDVHVVEADINPFSFFNLIFINNQRHSELELTQILLHEKTHAEQWHSIDNMIIVTISIMFWWNPFVWLMKREMTMNLEYLADHKVINKGVDISEYQYHLLKLTYHETAAHLVNNFNVSQLKQRIMMMNKSKTPARKLAKYLSIIPLVLLLISVNSIYAAQNDLKDTELQNPPPVKKGSDEVFIVVEEMPVFPGGTEAMNKFLAENVKYPVTAQENGIQGRVICSMIINVDGSISEVQVVRGVDPSLDKEAIRVIKSMPNWTPGKQSGKVVSVRYTLPVVFRLSSGDDSLLTKEEQRELANRGEVNELVIESKAKKAQNADEVFVVVENNPEFPSGTDGLMKFISENVKYPAEAQEKGIQGRVICTFIIGKDGSVSDVQVVRGVDPLLDAEAVRVLSSMPNWKPGKQRGQEVAVRYTFPVVFRLVGGESKDVVKAEFPGGNDAYFKYLADNIKYPVIAQENGIQGLVQLYYNIDTDGKVSFVKFEKTADASLDKEARRVIESMPAWKPATSNGKATRAEYMASFIFRLQGDEGSGFKSYDGETPEDAIVIVGYAKQK